MREINHVNPKLTQDGSMLIDIVTIFLINLVFTVYFLVCKLVLCIIFSLPKHANFIIFS